MNKVFHYDSTMNFPDCEESQFGVECLPERKHTMLQTIPLSLPAPIPVEGHQIQEYKFTKPTIEGNLRLAYSSALNFLRSNEAVEDSYEYSDALIGLWNAVESWKYNSNCKWTTYAIRCMRNAILDGRRKRNYSEELTDFSEHQPEAPTSCNGELVRELFTVHPHDTARDIRAKRALYDYYVEGQTLPEIGAKLGVSKNRAQQLIKWAVQLLRKRFPEEYRKTRIASI